MKQATEPRLKELARAIVYLTIVADGSPTLDEMISRPWVEAGGDPELAPSTIYPDAALERLSGRWGWLHIGQLPPRSDGNRRTGFRVVHVGAPNFDSATAAIGLCILDLYDLACDRFGADETHAALGREDWKLADTPVPGPGSQPVACMARAEASDA